MSLLLDALKQAERSNLQAQKVQASPAADLIISPLPSESANGLSLEPNDASDNDNQDWTEITLLPEFDPSPAQSIPQQEIEYADTAEFTPEVKEESLHLALEPEQAPLQAAAGASVNNTTEATEDQTADTPHAGQSHDVFVGAAKASPVDSNSPTTPTIEQTPPLQPVQPTSNRQLAEDVLLATKAPVKNRMPLILLGALVGLVAVAGYLYSLTLPPTPVYNAAPDSGTQTPAPETAPEPAMAVAETPGDAPSSAVMSEPEQDPFIDNTPTAPVAPPVQAPKSDPQPVAASITPAPPVQKNLNNGADTFIVESPDPIIIKVQQQPARAEAYLNNAYQLYQQQDYVGAVRYYQQVLQDVPNNIDALLGMGAAAEQLGDKATAESYYKKVQALDNGNVYAGNALVRLEQSQFPAEKESGYKMLLEKSPDAAQTHAELGNLYAGQERWSEAQQAYFNAMDKAPDNAEYAYNLAVSLDHLGKAAIARRYYQQALQLAKTSHASFDAASVYLRLQQLTEQ